MYVQYMYSTNIQWKITTFFFKSKCFIYIEKYFSFWITPLI